MELLLPITLALFMAGLFCLIQEIFIMMRYVSAFCLTVIAGFLAPFAAAQNTGGVFPPMVNEAHESAQYRIAINPDNAAGETG